MRDYLRGYTLGSGEHEVRDPMPVMGMGFFYLKTTTSPKSIINMSRNLDWSWKEPEKEVKNKWPKQKKLTKSQRRKKKKKAVKELALSALPSDFYSSREWRRVRYRVLKKYDGCCMLCGRSKKKHDVVLHVDHIKPRSKFPHLALVFDNLQILCEDCNVGKSNKDSTDWRPDNDDSEKLDIAHIESLKDVYI